MLNYKILNIKNKKAQVGETLTWTVATIAIFIILVLFVFAVSTLSNKKDVVFGIGNYITDKGSILAEQQVFFAILNKDGGKIKQLVEQGNLEGAQTEINKIFAEFEQQGLKCKLNKATLKIKNQEIGLECETV